MSSPLTPYERVTRANAALIDRGGRRMPSGYLQPEEAKALAELLAAGYAPNVVACIATAIKDAHKKIKRS